MPAHNVCPGLSRAPHTLQRLSHAALQPLIVTPVPLQPCDWTQSPELIGSVVQVLPQSPLEEDYPFDCASGMVGSADSGGDAIGVGDAAAIEAIGSSLEDALGGEDETDSPEM